MYPRDPAKLFELADDDSLTLDPEEKRALRRRLERANELETENRELREQARRWEEEKRRLQEELRRTKASAPFLATSDLTAEEGGVPTSRVFYRRPVRPRESRPSVGPRGHLGCARERPERDARPPPPDPGELPRVRHAARRAIRDPSEDDHR